MVLYIFKAISCLFNGFFTIMKFILTTRYVRNILFVLLEKTRIIKTVLMRDLDYRAVHDSTVGRRKQLHSILLVVYQIFHYFVVSFERCAKVCGIITVYIHYVPNLWRDKGSPDNSRSNSLVKCSGSPIKTRRISYFKTDRILDYRSWNFEVGQQ